MVVAITLAAVVSIDGAPARSVELYKARSIITFPHRLSSLFILVTRLVIEYVVVNNRYFIRILSRIMGCSNDFSEVKGAV